MTLAQDLEADALRRAAESVVALTQPRSPLSGATGFYIREGWVLTNAHVIRALACPARCPTLQLRRYGLDEGRAPELRQGATVIAIDDALDVAILRPDEPHEVSGLSATRLDDLEGDLTALGHPGLSVLVATEFTDSEPLFEDLLHAGHAVGGHSGSPVVDVEGRVVSILHSSLPAHDLGASVSIDEVLARWPGLFEGRVELPPETAPVLAEVRMERVRDCLSGQDPCAAHELLGDLELAIHSAEEGVAELLLEIAEAPERGWDLRLPALGMLVEYAVHSPHAALDEAQLASIEALFDDYLHTLVAGLEDPKNPLVELVAHCYDVNLVAEALALHTERPRPESWLPLCDDLEANLGFVRAAAHLALGVSTDPDVDVALIGEQIALEANPGALGEETTHWSGGVSWAMTTLYLAGRRYLSCERSATRCRVVASSLRQMLGEEIRRTKEAELEPEVLAHHLRLRGMLHLSRHRVGGNWW